MSLERAQPTFSVVVATRNRPSQLGACLTALAALQYPADCFEVIVVDDGSSGALDLVVEPFSRSLSIRLVTQPKAGPAAARNKGADAASATVLVFTDDDCQPDPGWLAAFAQRLARAPEAMIGGQTLNALPRNPFSTASQQLITYLYGYYNKRPHGGRFFCTNNLAVPARLFRAFGGFDMQFAQPGGEDREFCERWLARGHRMIYEPAAIVSHAHWLTLGGFLRQHFRYGRGAWRVHRLRAERQAERSRIEPLSFYLDMLRFPFSQPEDRGGVHAALLAVSQAANASGFFWEALRHAAVRKRSAMSDEP